MRQFSALQCCTSCNCNLCRPAPEAEASRVASPIGYSCHHVSFCCKPSLCDSQPRDPATMQQTMAKSRYCGHKALLCSQICDGDFQPRSPAAVQLVLPKGCCSRNEVLHGRSLCLAPAEPRTEGPIEATSLHAVKYRRHHLHIPQASMAFDYDIWSFEQLGFDI